MSILIAVGVRVGRCLGSQPRPKVSMMTMRPPQQVHGRGSMRGWSGAVVSGEAGGSELTGRASSLRARAMFAARWPLASKPVMADAMEALRQDVHQEAADELVRCERHGFVAGRPLAAVVLPAEGDAAIIQGDEAGFEIATRWV